MKRVILDAVSKAVDQAAKSDVVKHRHGAVALYRGKITGVGFNTTKRTSALQRLYARKVGKYHHVYPHAEVAAVDSAGGKIDELVVVRVSKNGNLLNSKPCNICQTLLKDFKVKKVYYSIENEIRCLSSL